MCNYGYLFIILPFSVFNTYAFIAHPTSLSHESWQEDMQPSDILSPLTLHNVVLPVMFVCVYWLI